MDPLFHWAVPSHIKEEGSESIQALLSPPTTPSSLTFSSSPGLLPRASRPNSPSPPTSGRARPRPYPQTKPVLKKSHESLAQTSRDMQWHNSHNSMRGSSRPVSGADRRFPTEGERQTAFDNSQIVNGTFMVSTTPNSSLLGAMGETSDGQYGRVTALYDNTTIGWNSEVPMMPGNTGGYPGVPGHSALYSSLPTEYGSLDSRNSPESIAPNSPPYYPQLPGTGYVGVGPYRAPSTSSSGGSQSPYSRDDPETELRRLRKKVGDLQQALIEARSAAQAGTSHSVNTSTGFRTSLKRRTEARKKLFCSLNRAGNALCAWHDSRRERRQYPPRNAPAGTLNCGCTHEEALFEESLSRHGVGGYLPGESVRMDPELRRPLLKLLQRRYGYKDGDFDYDPQTMEWYADQGPEHWERQVHAGSSARARKPDHVDRH